VKKKHKSVFVLLVEDEPAHAAAIQRAVEASGSESEVKVVGTLREFRQSSADRPPNIAVMDLNLPDGRATEVLTCPPEAGLFPILVMTSYGNEQLAVEAIKAGALDYVVKSAEAFAMMPRTVERALREWKLLTERREAVAAQQRLIAQLEEALSKVKTLSGLLPICSACKKIRDDQGYWSQVEGYIQEHTDARFTHSYCPECARKFLSKVERSDPNTQ
jgi:DNA-binding NtrC family response regulator